MKFIGFLFLFSILIGSDPSINHSLDYTKWSIRLYGGYASHRPLVAIMTYGDIQPERHNTGIRGLDVSCVFIHNWRNLPIDWSFRVGTIRHLENGYQPNHNQYNGFLMVHFKTKHGHMPMRWFIGEGLSWSELVPYVEGRETRRLSDERDSQLMNYINVGFDFKLGDLIQQSDMKRSIIGFAVSHRSGVYQSVKWFNYTRGGGNFITIFMEYCF